MVEEELSGPVLDGPGDRHRDMAPSGCALPVEMDQGAFGIPLPEAEEEGGRIECGEAENLPLPGLPISAVRLPVFFHRI